MPAHRDQPIEERLARADRAIRREQLAQKIRELGGIVSEPGGDDVSETELAFLSRVVAWETRPFSTHREWLARRGQVFAAPERLRSAELTKELWRLIKTFAVARVFLCHTNHLSDAELYARLWNEVLAAEAPDFARTPDDACHWDFASAGDGEETIWLTYYASAKDREDWVLQFPDVVLPPPKPAPYRRDDRLPVRD